MSNRKPNKNSLEAYKMLHKEMKSDHYGKILFAMRLLGISASSEAIAKKAGMDKDKVYRRMNELCSDGLVYVSANGLTSSNRPCSLYSLTQHGKEKQEANVIEQPKEQQLQTQLFQ